MVIIPIVPVIHLTGVQRGPDLTTLTSKDNMYGTIRTHQWRFTLGIPSSLNLAIYETVLPFRKMANGTIKNAWPYLPSFVRKRLATYRTQITMQKLEFDCPETY